MPRGIPWDNLPLNPLDANEVAEALKPKKKEPSDDKDETEVDYSKKATALGKRALFGVVVSMLRF